MTYASSSSMLAPDSPRLLVLLAVCALVGAGCPDGEDQVDSPTSATEGTSSNSNTSPTDPTVGDADGTTDPATDTDPDANTDTGADTQGMTEAESASTGDAPGVCGDAQIDPGEQCDDGPVNADDAACTSACELATCGDGYIQLGVEECDDGLDNDNSGACTHECREARCGDDEVYLGVEECDDGDVPTEDDPVINDDNAYGGCTTQCVKGPRCGDGDLQPEEECDDGEEPDLTVCTKECTSVSRVVFVTSVRYNGDLGGPEGADQICQTLAAQGGRANPQTFRAWVSSGAAAPLDWPVDTMMRYQLPTGMIVADDWDALTSGQLKTSINQTESETSLGDGDNASVWTGTLADGSKAPWTCNGWTSDTQGVGGRSGLATLPSKGWTDTIDQKCSSLARLYCVEVW